jgi:hypothetical protein
VRLIDVILQEAHEDDFETQNTPGGCHGDFAPVRALNTAVCVGYKPTAAKSINEYAKLDENDESLARWKASLGITGEAFAGDTSKPKVRHCSSPLHPLVNARERRCPAQVTVQYLELTSPSLPSGKTIKVDISSPQMLQQLKENPIQVKEGAEYKYVSISNDGKHYVFTVMPVAQGIRHLSSEPWSRYGTLPRAPSRRS